MLIGQHAAVGGKSRGAARRTARRTLVALAGACMIVPVFALSAPQRAQAFAWSDSCVFRLFNKTASAGDVRLTSYLPVPPDAKYVALAISYAFGIPTDVGGLPLANTGWPFTGGCTAYVTFNNPGDNASCYAHAPTSGANTFNCSGNVTYGVLQDDDDIKGWVRIPAGPDPFTPMGSAFDPAAAIWAYHPVAKLTSTTSGRGILRRADLKGIGWRDALQLSDFGEVGRLVSADSLPASCDSRGKLGQIQAVRGGASAFARKHGAQVEGSLYGVYSSAVQSKRALNAAISPRSIGCLARLLTSKRVHSRVLTLRESAGGWRLLIRRRARPTAYLDLVGGRRGRGNAVLLFINSGTPTSSSLEQSALAAVLRRLS
jgi:hypothetical protein